MALDLRRGGLAASLVVFGLGAAFAQTAPAPFKCDIQPDTKSVRVSITNPHAHEAHCTAHCEFSTPKSGAIFMVECATTVGASAKDFMLCTKTYDQGTLVKMTEGKGDCLNNEVKESKDDDEDSEALIQRMQKQGQEMLDAMKKKKP